MKSSLSLAASAALIFLACPQATAADHAAHQHSAAPTAAVALSEGVVKKLDKPGGKITLAHGPLENLGMPAMTMSFTAQDKSWLDRFKVGDKVRFRVEELNGVYTLVRIEAVK